ncbi:DUF3943 domain-containing protein [Nitrococcus mobilis]|nr:DUF3943 domain-containing protein [Nitrococcus mobilis]
MLNAVLGISSSAHAALPFQNSAEHRSVPEPVITSVSKTSATCPLIFDHGDMTIRRFMVRRNAVSTVLSGSPDAIFEEETHGATQEKHDRIESEPRKATGTTPATRNPFGNMAEQQSTPKIDFKKPVLYSLSFMAIGFGGFVAAGILENSPSADNFVKAFTSPPKFDDDPLLFNFVLHPLWGSETYLRAREAHFGVPGSIAFSFGASFTWEYFYESWAQQPSTQDLIVTTGVGWIIGEARYYLKKRLDPKNYWWIDPINTTLEYFNIGVSQDRTGNIRTTLRLSWDF